MATHMQRPMNFSVFAFSQNLPPQRTLLESPKLQKQSSLEDAIAPPYDPTSDKVYIQPNGSYVCVHDPPSPMPVPRRRSLALLASVFHSSSPSTHSQSGNLVKSPNTPSFEDPLLFSDPASPSDSSPEPSPMKSERSRSAAVFYDDLTSPNIEVLSIHSASVERPEASLLDEDPFADLSSPPSEKLASPGSATVALPSSPLSPTNSLIPFPSSSLGLPEISPNSGSRLRRVSAGPRPATQKPAFRPLPSLPSLSTLAKMNVKIPKKVRKGNVGAHLPYEPWDIDLEVSVTSAGPTSPVSLPLLNLPPLGSDSEDEEESYGEPLSKTIYTSPEEVAPSKRLEDQLPHGFDDDALAARSRTTSLSSAYTLEPNDWFIGAESPYSYSYPDDPVSSSQLSFHVSSTEETDTRSDTHSLSFSSSSSCSSLSEYSVSSELSELSHSSDAISPSSTSLGEKPSLIDCNHTSSSLSSASASSDSSIDGDEGSSAARGTVATPEPINANLLHVCEESAAQSQLGSFVTSTGTIRGPAGPLSPTTRNSSSSSSSPSGSGHSPARRLSVLAAEMWIKGGIVGAPAVDGGDGRSYQRGRSTSTNGNGWSASNGSSSGGAYRGRGYSSASGGYGGWGGDDDEDGDNHRRNRQILPAFATSASAEESEEEDEEESSSDDYGQATGLPPTRADSDDDDVPLARSIPTALKAQQSIRLKDREARERRRKERETRAAARSQQLNVARSRSLAPAAISSSQEAALHASKSIRRPTANALPPKSAPAPFAFDDLTKKLESVQTSALKPNSVSAPLPRTSVDGNVVPTKAMTVPPPIRNLRPMRSFHKPEPRVSTEEWNAVPLPSEPDHKVARANTRSRARSAATRDDPNHHVTSPPTRSHTLPAAAAVEELPPQKLERKRTVKTADPSKTPRTSIEHSRPPPLPAPAEVIARQNNAKVTLTQQRIFIGDRQRFVVVEVSPSTSAGEVIKMVEAQGALKEWRGTGGWLLFEIAQDFGMERPVRNFELLSDIEASWNKDKLVNVFLMKLTPFAPLLSRSALPTSSPTHSGYVEWESKRGKWNKRYLMLKEHCLWLSKRDNGRDEVMLCSLSNFDAYQITRLVKAPKDFTFAVKSTDNLSFFENTADYLHIFSCKTDSGEKWMEKILLARASARSMRCAHVLTLNVQSYVLYQERNVLFQSVKSPPPPTTTSASAGLSRSVTKKRAPQPLVNVDPDSVFEKGTLLRR